jgi:hypothetical protein
LAEASSGAISLAWDTAPSKFKTLSSALKGKNSDTNK